VCPASHPGYLPRKKLKPHLPRSEAGEALARAHGFLIEVPPPRRLEPANDAQLASREGCAALPPPPGAAALHATLSKLSYVPPEPTDPPSTFSYSSLLGSSRILQEAKGGHRYVEAKGASEASEKTAARRRRKRVAGVVVGGRPPEPPPAASKSGSSLASWAGLPPHPLFSRPNSSLAPRRYTTDDVVTAYVAFPHLRPPHRWSHLDLGCGNSSVLLQLAYLSRNPPSPYSPPPAATLPQAGVEAREQALRLSRGSVLLAYGEGSGIEHVHGDFRRLADAEDELKEALPLQSYALITGTPPYFEISVKEKAPGDGGGGEGGDGVASTIIEGGMPSNLQSAPARCEFRGGVEAYAAAAAPLLAEGGAFVVCENALNDRRVFGGAGSAGLRVVDVLDVHGVSTKPALFSVYTLRKGKEGGEGGEGGESGEGAGGAGGLERRRVSVRARAKRAPTIRCSERQRRQTTDANKRAQKELQQAAAAATTDANGTCAGR
jgi:tRNA1(Val) A37 N6-methylase TrmN6